MNDWKIEWVGKDIYEKVRNFCNSFYVRGTDVEQYLQHIINSINKGEDIELKDGTILRTRGEKEKFLEEELERAIIHILRQL